MFSQTLYSTLTNLAPYWSNNLVSSLSLGNEYSMAINMIIGEFIKYYITGIKDEYAIFIIIIYIVLFLLYKFNIVNLSSFCIREPNVTVLYGKEFYDKDKVSYDYNTSLLALNYYLINKYGVKNIRLFNKDSKIIENIENYKITNKIILSVKREKNDNITIVNYKLYSYSENLDNFINDAIKFYVENANRKNSVTFIGVEKDNVLNYSYQLKAMIYILITEYNFKNITYMPNNNNNNNNNNNTITNNGNTNGSNTDNDINNSSNNNNNSIFKNKNNTSENIKTTNTNDNEDNITYDENIMLNETNDFYLYDDLYLTITKNNNNVNYELKSNTSPIKKFVDDAIQKYKLYNKTINNYKYEISFVKSQIYIRDAKSIMYTYIYKAFVHYVTTNNLLNNYTYIDSRYALCGGDNNTGDKKSTMIDKINIHTIAYGDGELYVSQYSEKTEQPTGWDKKSYEELFITLKSNTVNIQKFINDFTDTYDLHLLNNKQIDNKIYHFIYLGMKDDKLIFTHTLICDFDDETTLSYETFDNIKNEYVDYFKNEIKMLHNDDYYKKTGMKRKKSWVFHGGPGTGKTSTVMAMALYDRRHIITIPFGIVKTNVEFHKIMDLTSINDIKINNDKKILLFEELDIGCSKYNRNTSTNNSTINNSNDKKNDTPNINLTISDVAEKDKTSELSLDIILSRLDGIGNYNKLIIIATTNYYERLDASLTRDLRLTPIKFDYLRKCDVIELIEKIFNNKITDENKEIITDRTLSPAKLLTMCEQNYNIDINTFVNNLFIK